CHERRRAAPRSYGRPCQAAKRIPCTMSSTNSTRGTRRLRTNEYTESTQSATNSAVALRSLDNTSSTSRRSSFNGNVSLDISIAGCVSTVIWRVLSKALINLVAHNRRIPRFRAYDEESFVIQNTAPTAHLKSRPVGGQI